MVFMNNTPHVLQGCAFLFFRKAISMHKLYAVKLVNYITS